MDTLLEQQLKEKGYTGDFTLSSLIEACGEGFYSLDKMEDHKDLKIYSWAVNLYKTIGSIVYDTPEEAVANLWLELKKLDTVFYNRDN